MTTSVQLGHDSETLALTYLEQQGLLFKARNFRCKVGEIDLILYENNVLVFVEVRRRNHRDYGSGLESITPSKQHRLFKAAIYYLMTQDLVNKVDCRFDIISIDQHNTVDWIKNTFEPNDDVL